MKINFLSLQLAMEGWSGSKEPEKVEKKYEKKTSRKLSINLHKKHYEHLHGRQMGFGAGNYPQGF
jgi:hypothetical protein